MKHFYAVILNFFIALNSIATAGDRFDRTVDVFNAANLISSDQMTGEQAWAGYCITAEDEVSDALFAYRSSEDPVLGKTIKTLALEVEGSSNFFVRMDEATTRKQVEDITPGAWNDGMFTSGELISDNHWRFHTTIRQAVDPQTSKLFFVSLRQCKSADGRECNGHGDDPFIRYAACYYYVQKF